MTVCNSVPRMTIRNLDDAGKLLPRDEAARYSGFSLSTIDRYLRDGTLTRHRKGKRRVLIARAELDSLLRTEAVAS